MTRRVYRIGALALALFAAGATHVTPGKILSSARTVGSYAETLRNSESPLSPVERVLFRLISSEG
jgi:hypothetical protein